MTPAGRRLLGLSHGILPVTLCALAAHAVIYASFWPSDGAHGYFGWYEPTVVGLGATAVVAVVALSLAGLLGEKREWTTRLHRLLPAPDEPGVGIGARTVGLVRASIVFLFLQETLERSLSAGRLTPATFSASTWCLALAASAAFALLLVVAGHAGARLIERVLGAAPRMAVPRDSAGWPRLESVPSRRNPLADRRGLRAPPLLAG